MRYGSPLFLLALFTVVSCSGGSEPAKATSLAANSSATISSAAGVAVSPPPSVIVKDQHGNPMSGVTVTFAVTSGGGSLAGGAFSSAVTTGTDGVATVGSWVLGQKAGANVLTASSGSLASVTFTANSVAGPPSEAAKIAGDNTAAVVGTSLPAPPSVLVKDAFGNPVQGVNVTFAIGLGGGSLTNATRTTGADGIATVGSWTIGTVATTNTMTATAGSLAPVTFSVTAIAGPPSRVIATVGNGITGRAGTRVRVEARVTDAFNNGVINQQLSFTVASGGGTIIGNSVLSTDQSGTVVMVGWILGPNPGLNTLTASLTTVGSVTFSVTGIANTCILDAAHTIGGVSIGTLTTNDCALLDGTLVRYYPVQLASPTSFQIRQASSSFDAYTYFTDANGLTLAEADDDESSQNSLMMVLAPAGSYRIGASTFDLGESGPYSLSSAVVAESEEACNLVFIIPGITTTQRVSASDCINQVDKTLHADIFAVKLTAGSSITTHMASAAVDPFIELYNVSTLARVAFNDNVNTTTTDAEVTYVVPVTDYYYLVARTAVGGQVGAYTLSVTRNGSSLMDSQRANSPQVRALYPRKQKLKLPWVER